MEKKHFDINKFISTLSIITLTVEFIYVIAFTTQANFIDLYWKNTVKWIILTSWAPVRK